MLTSRETEVQIQLRQMSASVSLVMALGGGWDASQLPNKEQLTAKQPKTIAPGTTTPNTAAQSIAALMDRSLPMIEKAAANDQFGIAMLRKIPVVRGGDVLCGAGLPAA